ncbi:MAG: hypothetical protein K6B70_04305 [Clostridia bacterium]|nr:hypothetical protein [Clostridia bacterium]
MENNMLVDGLLEKVPQVKDAVEKIENATGKKVEDIAQEVGGKITDAIKENGQEDPKEVLGNIAGKIFGK